MDDTDPKRLFEGEALLRRMYKYGLLDESQNKLDYVLALTPQDFLERRLQTLVFKLGLAKSIHHARVLIKQKHIRYHPALLLHDCGVLSRWAWLESQTLAPSSGHSPVCAVALQGSSGHATRLAVGFPREPASVGEEAGGAGRGHGGESSGV